MHTKGGDGEVNVAIQADGKILVATDSPSFGRPLLTRLRANGKVDHSFGTNGRVSVRLSEVAGVEVLRSGEILVVGTISIPYGIDPDFALIRLRQSGAPDQRFGTEGRTTVDFHLDGEPNPSFDHATAVALRPDGGVILCGRSNTSSAEGRRNGIVLAGLGPDGSLDPTFGDGGRVFADPEAGAAPSPREDGSGGGEGVAIGTRGSAVFGGTIHGKFTASVYTPFGRPEPLFAGDGTAIIDSGDGRDDADALAVAPDQSVYLAGSVRGRSSRDYAVVRLTNAGVPDGSFGEGGVSVIDFTGDFDDADGIAVRPNGKILVSGTVGDDRIGVIRLLGD
jgi:uncharacterized delta-60 repeat protein